MNERSTKTGLFVVASVLLASAAVLSWWAVLESPRREVNRSIRLIQRIGGNVGNVSSCPKWLYPRVRGTFALEYFRWVNAAHVFHDGPLRREDEDYLASLRHLDSLQISFGGGVDAARVLAPLPTNRDLVFVGLSHTSSLPRADSVPNLERLHLNQPRVTGTSTSELREYEKLRELRLFGPTPEAASLIFTVLPEARTLESLELVVTDLPERGREDLGRLAGIERLRIVELVAPSWNARLEPWMTDEHLDFLAQLPSLEDVDIVARRVGVGPLITLASLPGLKRAELRRLTIPNDPALGRLAKLPSFRVKHDVFGDGWERIQLVREPTPRAHATTGAVRSQPG